MDERASAGNAPRLAPVLGFILPALLLAASSVPSPKAASVENPLLTLQRSRLSAGIRARTE